ncbi:hypothetical protein [Streptomyces sp. NPDC005476]|uniref:hypothetical protein n=1 Tax=Streptomyces sp. NPDC005476 TaxID=3156882 RepID=UPI0034536BF4
MARQRRGGDGADLVSRLVTEIRIKFEELIPRLAGIRLAGDVPRVRSNFVNGIKKLPVEVTPT